MAIGYWLLAVGSPRPPDSSNPAPLRFRLSAKPPPPLRGRGHVGRKGPRSLRGSDQFGATRANRPALETLVEQHPRRPTNRIFEFGEIGKVLW